MTSQLDADYLKGIQHFNRREFYDAHEVWEDVWNREQGKPHEFIQGLIQFATSLHHFESSNMKGTMILYRSGVELLQPMTPIFWRLPVDKLINDMTMCVRELMPYTQVDLPGRYHPDKKKFPVQIKAELIPTLTLIDHD